MANLGSFQGVGPIVFGGVDGGSALSFVSADSTPFKGKVNVGDRVRTDGEEYVFVHNAGASIAAIGNFMVMSSLSGYSLTISSISGAHLPMCVVKHSAIPAGGFGWALVHGISRILSESTMATGAILGVGTDGAACAFPISANTDVTKNIPWGTVLSTGTGTAASYPLAYVKCYG